MYPHRACWIRDGVVRDNLVIMIWKVHWKHWALGIAMVALQPTPRLRIMVLLCDENRQFFV